MQYISKKELSVNRIEKDVNEIGFHALAKIIYKKPSNIIYFEKEGKLSGIISMGDIKRACEQRKNEVRVNTNFLCVKMGEFARAKEIFRKNIKINEVPVIDEDGLLVGEYSRWENTEMLKCMLDGLEKVIELWMRNQSVILVKPCVYFESSLARFYDMCHLFSLKYEIVECIDFCLHAKHLNQKTLFLFASESESSGMYTLLTYILGIDLSNIRFLTYRSFINEIQSQRFHLYLKELMEQGITVYNLLFSRSNYYHELIQRLHEKYADAKEQITYQLPFAMYKGFFDELYTKEYAYQIANLPVYAESKDGIGKLKDSSSTFYNVINGERKTVGQPHNCDRNLYFYGPCFIYGHYVEDKYTIESLIQQFVNEDGYAVKVINKGGLYDGKLDLEMAYIMDTSLKKGDIIVLYANNQMIEGVVNIDLMDVLQANEVSVSWMADAPWHCNHKINLLYAHAIYSVIKPIISQRNQWPTPLIKQREDYVKLIYIDKYFAGFNGFQYDKVGSIVMNCNPFTFGHRFLIEQAMKTVDYLIVFVVEENRSVFSFNERFAMVSEGVEDLKNIKVVPSGPFILSQTTFPEYFVKEADEDIVENTENDIILFAEKIAPYLNIKYRFVGTEKDDNVTREYNNAMKRVLPKYNIHLIEILRKEHNDKSISASLVRNHLEHNNTEDLEGLIPSSTKKMLGLS